MLAPRSVLQAPAPQAPPKPAVSQLTLGLVLLGLALAAAASLWHVLPAAQADASTLAARTKIDDWRRGTGPRLTLDRWQATRTALQNGLRLAPGNAQLHDDLGFLNAAFAQRLGNPEPGSAPQVMQLELLDQTIAHYRAASQLRPTFPYSWANLALALHYRDSHTPEFWAAFDHALQYARHEESLHPTLAYLAFANWPDLGEPRQQAMLAIVDSARKGIKVKLDALAVDAGVTLPTAPAAGD